MGERANSSKASNCLRPNGGEMVIDPFSLRQVPLQKTDDRSLPAQVLSEFCTSDPHLIFRVSVGIERDDDLAILPGNPVQVRNGTFHIDPLTIRTSRFADSAAPVENS